MGQASALSQCQRLGGRLEGAWYGFIVNGAAARLWGSRGKREVADGDALEVAQLAILVHTVSGEGKADGREGRTYGSSHGRSRGGDLSCSAAWSPAMLCS